ncbi:hypothetical protein [Polaribacter sp. NJDZ03]|uniref:hypothetical protein n=1 Tax=Polaribacter sp. NJDZ03 TaxID=2855841 RepID=UPI0020C77979|nr:hypothetical protein [Polaribacter sp. NJDZ03]
MELKQLFIFSEKPKSVEIEIKYDVVNNFVYGVKNQSKLVSQYLIDEDNLGGFEEDCSYLPITYFGDYRKGYDVRLFTKDELISDVLKHYERLLAIISKKKTKCLLVAMRIKNKSVL